MIVWPSLFWLIGLALIPLIWGLHKFRRSGREIPVSSLVLWRIPADSGETGRRIEAAERIWLLRAFIGSGLALALAGPGWVEDAQPPVHLWLDDSSSMGAVEEGGSNRMLIGLEQLLAALDERGPSRVEARSLTDPYRPVLHLEGDRRSRWRDLLIDWATITEREPQPPALVQMTQNAEHWVLTDGADGKVSDWIAAAPISRVLQIGKATENTAVDRLSLRPDPNRSGAWQGLIRISNAGLKPAKRTLTLSVPGRAPGEWEVDAPVGATRQIQFSLPESPGGEVVARLWPADALDLDDRLSLTFTHKIVVRIAGECEPHVLAALKAHPRLAWGGEPRLTILCGEFPAPEDGALLWLHRAKTAHGLQSPAVWLERAGKLRGLFLANEWLRIIEEEKGVGMPLLVSGSTSLISLEEFPRRRVDCYLDLSQPEFVRQPQFPVLIAGLIDAAVDADLLDGVESRSRSASVSRIAPQALPEHLSQIRHGITVDRTPVDLTDILIPMILIALLLDVWLSARYVKKPLAG